MRVVPRTLNGKISFYTTHVPKWAEDPEAIGSTPEEIADVQDKLDAAREALKQQRQAQIAARSATSRMSSAFDALSNAGGSVILRVRAKARIDGKPVYNKAWIRTPKKASPIAEPGQPNAFRWQLRSGGTLRLTWKCKNPRGSQGTIYQVYRRLDLNNFSVPPQYLGASGRKEFIDTTLPAGTATALYEVHALRGRTKGPVASQIVNFGVSAAEARLLQMSRAA